MSESSRPARLIVPYPKAIQAILHLRRDLLNMHALKQSGMALIAAQRFRDAVIEFVSRAASNAIL